MIVSTSFDLKQHLKVFFILSKVPHVSSSSIQRTSPGPPSLHSYLRSNCLYLAVGEAQHPEGPQPGEGSAADLRQVVSSQLQQPGAVWEAPGNLLEPTGTTIHQVSVFITDALLGAQL